MCSLRAGLRRGSKDPNGSESDSSQHQLRRCLVCRKRDKKENLLRLVAEKGRIVWDKDQKCAGRGAYLHQRIECVTRAGQAAMWERALRIKAGDVRASASDVRGLAETVKELSDFIGKQLDQDVKPTSRLRM